MNIFELTLNICCSSFTIFLLILYFSKKSINNSDNKIFPFILLANCLVTFGELILFISTYLLKDNMIVIDFFRKLSFTGINYFFIIIGYYAMFIALEKSDKVHEFVKKHNVLFNITCFLVLFIVTLVQFLVKETYVYSATGYVTHSNTEFDLIFVTVIACIFWLAPIPVIIANWKKINKKKLIPFLFVLLLEIVSLILNIISPAICPAALVLTLTSFIMYHTIDNPDLKEIAKLELAKAQAEKSNKAKSDFLSSMSHELRTPLNAIVGLSQMISDADDLESVKSDSKDIIVASQSLLELVNGILDINKLEANKMEIVSCEYNTRDVLNNIVRLIKIRIGEKKLELVCNFDSNLPDILYGDCEKLKQIITNLLTNAVKYTESGTVTFNVSCTNIKDKCNLVISVKDTGRGMKEEMLPNLFTKFYRLEEDKDTDIEGTGLGLAITKNLVELFNGEINVESTYGVGSTFTVKLVQDIIKEHEYIEENTVPLKIEPEDNLLDTIEMGPVEDNNKDILLVVDDNNINLKVASRMFTNFNFEVDEAHSGMECLEKVKNNKNKYNLIFMDIMMPEMDGVETMKKLKEIEGFNTPVIALTADSMDGSREKYLAVGFDEYIAKPVIREIVEKTLNKFVDLDSIEVIKTEDITKAIKEAKKEINNKEDVEVL